VADDSTNSRSAPTVGPGSRRSTRSERRRRRRIARFTRPPAPRDWRWAVGGLGRILVSISILMFAFVGYQLWGTGIATARAQGELETAFAQLISSTTTSPPTTDPAPTTTVPEGATPTSVAPTTTLPPPPPFPAPPRGEPLARIEIPSIGVDKIVVEGIRYADLRKGPGHFPESPLPGQYGNAAIAGHRTTYGEPFVDIDRIKVGDEIVITAAWGSRYVYVVTESLIVAPDDYLLVVPTLDPRVASLALISCNPKFSTRERIVVRAVVDAERSDPVTLAGTPGAPDLRPLATTTLPGGPETSVAASSTVPSATSTPTATTAAPVTSPPVTSPPVTGTVPTVEIGTDGEEVFESSWFDDPDAYPAVAFWGLLLTAIAFAATALSRKVMRNWVGLAVGIIPFVVALYFFFVNISRMMPANL
jgi:sortase A